MQYEIIWTNDTYRALMNATKLIKSNGPLQLTEFRISTGATASPGTTHKLQFIGLAAKL